MATKTASVIQSGTSNYLTPAESFNVVATDLLTPGIVGSYTNTSGVAPATGSFAVNAQGSPNMTVAVSAGQAYVSATPTGGTAQNIRVKMTSSEDVTIAANSTGSTRYDFVYIKVDADKLVNPAADGTDVVTLVAQRSTTQDADSNGALANALLIAVVTVSNGASSIANSNITDRRLPVNSQTDGWQQANETWTYASATTITVPTGAAFKYSVGDKVKYMQSGVWKYAYVTGVTATTLTLNGGSDYTLANATIAAPCYSKRATPVGFPQYFNYTPTMSASGGGSPAVGNGTMTAKFSITGRTVNCRISITYGSTTSFGTGVFRASAPITAAYSSKQGVGVNYIEDLGAQAYIGFVELSSTYVEFSYSSTSASGRSAYVSSSASQPFAWGTGDYFNANFSYEI